MRAPARGAAFARLPLILPYHSRPPAGRGTYGFGCLLLHRGLLPRTPPSPTDRRPFSFGQQDELREPDVGASVSAETETENELCPRSQAERNYARLAEATARSSVSDSVSVKALAQAAEAGDAQTIYSVAKDLMAAHSDPRYQNTPGPMVDPRTFSTVFATLEKARKWRALDWWATCVSRTALDFVETPTSTNLFCAEKGGFEKGISPECQFLKKLDTNAGRQRLKQVLTKKFSSSIVNPATVNLAMAKLGKQKHQGLPFALDLCKHLNAIASGIKIGRRAKAAMSVVRGALVVAVAASGQPVKAWSLLQTTIGEGFVPPTDVFGYYFNSLAPTADNADWIYQIFQDYFASDHVKLTQFVSHILLERFVNHPMRLGKVIARMQKQRIWPKTRAYECVISAALRNSDERMALNALDELRNLRAVIPARSDAYCQMAYLYAKMYMNRDAALRVLDQMLADGVRPRKAEAWLPALHARACVAPVDMSGAEKLMEEMLTCGQLPTGEHYAKLVTGYGVYLGNLDEAERVVTERLHGPHLRKPPVKPESAWLALAAAYAHHHDLPGAVRVYRSAVKLASADGSIPLPGHVGNYVIAACAAADPPDFSTAAEIFEEMQASVPATSGPVSVPVHSCDSYLAMIGAHVRSASYGANPGGVMSARCLYDDVKGQFPTIAATIHPEVTCLMRVANGGDDGEAWLWLRRLARHILRDEHARGTYATGSS